ncbi:MAG: hypothetical protein ABMA64_27385, partial [Myxococcota bacterium]
VTSTPAGLRYRVADKEGTTPARVDLPVGSWEVELFQGDRSVHTATLQIEPGEVEVVNVALPPPAPEPAVVVAPPPAPPVAVAPPAAPVVPTTRGVVWVESPNLYGEVVVDGKSYGYAPVKVSLPTGPATIELKVGKSVRRSQGVVVSEGENHVVLR